MMTNLIQSEFRKKKKNSDYILDISQFLTDNENSKGHYFIPLIKILAIVHLMMLN